MYSLNASETSQSNEVKQGPLLSLVQYFCFKLFMGLGLSMFTLLKVTGLISQPTLSSRPSKAASSKLVNGLSSKQI